MARRLIKKVIDKTSKKPEYEPFDEVNVVEPLKLVIIIVPYGQANGVVKILNSLSSAMNLICNGEGTFMRESTLSGSKKQLIFSFVREDKIDEFKTMIQERFSISNATKGIAFTIKLTSVAGVSVYKFLSNSRKVVKKGESNE